MESAASSQPEGSGCCCRSCSGCWCCCRRAQHRPNVATGADEAQPLLGDVPKAKLLHRDSVYSFVIFMPPLTRRTHGHYCTLPVLLAGVLFVLTVTCQLGLTVIAGAYIQTQSSNFKVSLIRHETYQPTAMTPFGYVRESGGNTIDNINAGLDPPGVSGCCNSAECLELSPCCGPGGKNPHTHHGYQLYQSVRDSRSFLAVNSRGNTTSPGPSEKMIDVLDTVKEPVKKIKDVLDTFVYGSGGDVILCRKGEDGILDCTPPSFAFLDAWHELDDNGDGVWTVEEAEADRTNLGCRLGLSPVDFFKSTVKGIINDARDTADNSYAIPLVPQSIETSTSIPKDYFEQFKGLVVLCTAADVSRCGQMIHDGFFDGAIGLKSQVARGGIHDLDSSLDFCQRMLRPNGICEQSLPHTYRLYRSRLQEKCGSPSYDVGTSHTNPHDPRDAMSVVQVSYNQLSRYEGANETQFQTFLFFILLVWYVTMVTELDRIIKTFDMLVHFEICQDDSYSVFPKSVRENFRRIHQWLTVGNLDMFTQTPEASLIKPESDLNSPPSKLLIVADISRPHWAMCLTMCFIRLCLLVYMGNVGTTFLLATFGYDDLLFNAVALAFIFELPDFIYKFLISDEIKEQLEDAQTVEYPTSLPTGWRGLFTTKAFWGLFIIPFLVFIVCRYNYQQNILSPLEALRCACFQSGDSCVASRRFTSEWWTQYWKETFPLAKLRSSYLA